MVSRLHRSPSSEKFPDTPAGGDDRARARIDLFSRLLPFRRKRLMAGRALMRGGTALASTAVVTLSLLYVIAPASSAMTITAHDGGNAPSGSVVLYGSVLNGSTPIAGARVTVSSNSSFNNSSRSHSNGAQGHLVAQESTDAQGAYRLQLYVRPGVYSVEVSLANGSLHSDFHVQLSDRGSATNTGDQSGNGRRGDLETRYILPTNKKGVGGNRPSTRAQGVGSQGKGNPGTHGSGPAGTDVGIGHGSFPPGSHSGIVTSDQVLNLVPGVSYDVSAQLTTSNVLSFLPVSSY